MGVQIVPLGRSSFPCDASLGYTRARLVWKAARTGLHLRGETTTACRCSWSVAAVVAIATVGMRSPYSEIKSKRTWVGEHDCAMTWSSRRPMTRRARGKDLLRHQVFINLSSIGSGGVYLARLRFVACRRWAPIHNFGHLHTGRQGYGLHCMYLTSVAETTCKQG